MQRGKFNLVGLDAVALPNAAVWRLCHRCSYSAGRRLWRLRCLRCPGRPGGPGGRLLVVAAAAGGATAADVTAAVQLERLHDGRWQTEYGRS